MNLNLLILWIEKQEILKINMILEYNVGINNKNFTYSRIVLKIKQLI